jgi:hypothetical protein
MPNQGYLQRLSDVVFLSAGEFWSVVVAYIPNLIGAAILLIIGVIIARSFGRTTKKIFQLPVISKFVQTSRLNEALKTLGVEISVAEIVASAVYWAVMAIFLLSVSEVLGLEVVAKTLNQLISYIPRVVAAAIVLFLTFAVAKAVRDVVTASLKQIDALYYEIIGRLAGGVVVLLGTLIATTQLGFDVSILSANITLIVAGAALTLALSLGLGSYGLVANLLAKYYVNQLVKKGAKVTLAGFTGKVKEVSAVAVILETKDGDVIVPNKEVIERGSR